MSSVREAARQVLSPRLRQQLVHTRSRLRATLYRGDAVECPCCGGRFRAFMPYGVQPRRPAAECPGCGAMERHRLLWLYLAQRTDLLARPQRLLHIAPEPVFHARLRGRSGLRYVTGDLASELAMERFDITRLPHPDACFDAILCNHVLEHIPDDAAAMHELRRVLRPDGFAILQVPIRSELENTLEDASVTAPGERERLFGQWDHVRQYGLDYPERLRSAGLEVEAVPFFDQLPADRRARHGLKRETIYHCRRVS